ncbi:MAG: CRISPR-associated RAMP protein [Chloroflexi bacterium]|jgi:CRISPR-associated RAMP protein (TIGR02581 family)|nr:CRISPR-associated RAMP protein [Chloroflexota bacterium]
MLKRLYNEARFALTITTKGPVLIRSGHPTLTGPDMTPVLTYRNNDWQVYLPGSSLKGVMRSHLEKVCRTLRPYPPVVCNPFTMLQEKAYVEQGRLVCPEYADVFCGDKFERRSKETLRLKSNRDEWKHIPDNNLTPEVVYTDSCPICRLFGSTEFIGRVSINDAYLMSDIRPRPTETRDGVGINRHTGGSSHGALFNLEAVSSNVAFCTDIHLRNFECWQLGMLLLVVQDMADGLVRIGSGRSRGMGSITASIGELTISYIGLADEKPTNEVWGLGKFLGPDSAYGTQPDDRLLLGTSSNEQYIGIRRLSVFADAALSELSSQATRSFITRLHDWQIPERMTFAGLQFNR